MLGKRDTQDADRDNKGPRDKKPKTVIPSGQGTKAQSRCRSCKMPNHWYRDPECVYKVIKSLMENRDIEASVVQKLRPEIRELFKDGAGGFKTKASIGEIVKGLDTLPPDPNPILDEGAPTSTGGIENVVTLCDFLGIQLQLDPPRERYFHGWGENCLGAKMTICSWTLTIPDVHEKPTSLTFHLVPGQSPLIIGNDVRMHCNTFNLGDPVWVYYNTSKQNEPVDWIKATVVSAHPDLLEVRRSARGRPMRVAYEDVRFAPQSELTTELMSCSLEQELVSAAPTDPTNPHSPPNTTGATLLPDQPPPAIPTAHQETPSQQAALFSSASAPLGKPPEGGVRDVGPYATSVGQAAQSIEGQSLHRDDTVALEAIYEAVGSRQVTASQLAFAPPYILQEALRREHESNWADAYVEIPDADVPRRANVITSHIVYKLKTDEDGKRKMKARIVPHGNHDKEKDSVRKDSSNVPLFVVRLLLSLVTFLRFRIGTADIKGAFLQSGPIERDIYVRPPREFKSIRGTLGKLLKLPYGLADAGRQWQKTVETWMLDDVSLERVLGLSQLFVKRDDNGHISLLIAKVTDDFLLGGTPEAMEELTNALQKRFIVGKVIIDGNINFDGCEISQNADGTVTMSMVRYLERLRPIELSRSRKKERESRASDRELTQFLSLACTLMYLGNGVLPQAAYITSTLQQLIPNVRVEHLVTANDMLKEVMELVPKITFHSPPLARDIKEVMVSSFSDASFNHGTSSGYGQTGLLTGLRIVLHEGAPCMQTYSTPLIGAATSKGGLAIRHMEPKFLHVQTQMIAASI